MDEGDGREQDVGNGMLNFIDKLDVFFVGAIFIDEVVEHFPN